MPVVRTGKHHPQDFWVLLLRTTFQALGVAAAVLGVIFFVAGIGFLSDGAEHGNATLFLLGLPYTAFGLVGMWMAWRLLVYLEAGDVKQVIHLVCFGLFVMLLINLYAAWQSGVSMVVPLLLYALGAFCLWGIARRLPAFVCGVLFPHETDRS